MSAKPRKGKDNCSNNGSSEKMDNSITLKLDKRAIEWEKYMSEKDRSNSIHVNLTFSLNENESVTFLTITPRKYCDLKVPYITSEGKIHFYDTFQVI